MRLPSDEYDLTPEERVNVSVYESVNRSVVNINTKVPRSDIFSLFDIPGRRSRVGLGPRHRGPHPDELST